MATDDGRIRRQFLPTSRSFWPVCSPRRYLKPSPSCFAPIANRLFKLASSISYSKDVTSAPRLSCPPVRRVTTTKDEVENAQVYSLANSMVQIQGFPWVIKSIKVIYI